MSKTDDLLLDPAIRVWVFLPIVVITFFVGILRHYVSILISTQKKIELQQVQDSQALIRARLLRENGKYIPKQVRSHDCISQLMIQRALINFNSDIL